MGNKTSTNVNDKASKNIDKPPKKDLHPKYDEDIIQQILKLNIAGNRSEIINAMDNVVNPHDINDVVDYINIQKKKMDDANVNNDNTKLTSNGSDKVMTRLVKKFPDVRYSFRKCKKAFNSFSGNKKYITKSEVKPSLIQLGAESSSLSDDEITRIVNMVNLDNNNKIDFEHFLIAAAVGCFLKKNINLDNVSDEFKKIRKGFEVAREAFDVIDTERTGKIDFDELKSALLSMHMKHDDFILERLKELGFNDGKGIKFPEFIWAFIIIQWIGLDNTQKNVPDDIKKDVNTPQNVDDDIKNDVNTQVNTQPIVDVALPTNNDDDMERKANQINQNKYEDTSPGTHDGFYIQIVNATPFTLTRVQQHAYQIKWDFPTSIPANSISKRYAEWRGGGIFGTVLHDDGADVKYKADTSDGATIHIHCEYPGGIKLIYGQASNNDGTKWVFFPPPSKDGKNTAKLGWLHNGCLSVAIAFNKNGFVFPKGQGYYAESFDLDDKPKNYLRPCAESFASNWMTSYWPCINNLSLNELTLPGTHDTATFAKSLDGYSLWVHTQSQDIKGQLMSGIRAFDLRVFNKKYNGTSDDRFIMSHDTKKLDLKLKDLLDTIVDEINMIGDCEYLILDFHRFNPDPSLDKKNWSQKDLDDMIKLVFDTVGSLCISYDSNSDTQKPINQYPAAHIVVAIDKSLFTDKIKTKYGGYFWPEVKQHWQGSDCPLGFGSISEFMDGILNKIQTDQDIKNDLWSFQCAYNQISAIGAPAYIPEEISKYFSGNNCVKSNIVNIDWIHGRSTASKGNLNLLDDDASFPNFSNLMNAVPTNILKGFRKRMGYPLISKT